MRLLDDKKVSQVSQFDQMTSQTGVKYGYDNSIQLYAGSLCCDSYSAVNLAIFQQLIKNRSLDTGIYTFMHQTNAFGIRSDA